jgi:hypothetical protein
VDGIPNTLRHYRIAEYIFTHYKPYIIVNNYCVWKANWCSQEKNEINKIIDLKAISVPSDKADLKKLIFSDTSGIIYNSEKTDPKYFFHNNKLYFLSIKGYSKNLKKMQISYQANGKIQNKKFNFVNNCINAISLETAKPLYSLGNLQLFYDANDEINLQEVTLQMADHLPDHYSTRVIEMRDLKYIPYIWGQYDETFVYNGISVDTDISSLKEIIKANTAKKYTFKPITNKNSGNYLMIRARSTSLKPVDIIIQYGVEGIIQGSFCYTVSKSIFTNNYLLRISSQYNWIANENNWISIYPIDRDIAIESIKIYKGD